VKQGAVSGEEVPMRADAIRTARPRLALAQPPHRCQRGGRGQCANPQVLAAIAQVRRHRARAHAYRGRSMAWWRSAAVQLGQQVAQARR
jgi:hypothetical protein